MEVVEFLETKSVVNPKEIALAKREEMKKKGEIKSPGKKKGRKSVLLWFHSISLPQVSVINEAPSIIRFISLWGRGTEMLVRKLNETAKGDQSGCGSCLF